MQLKSNTKAGFSSFLFLITFTLFRSFLVVFAISFQKQPISYSLLINPSSLFSIRQETGEISLTRTLDYESDQRRYLLMVRASEEPGGLSTATEVGLIRDGLQAVNVTHTRVHALRSTNPKVCAVILLCLTRKRLLQLL